MFLLDTNVCIDFANGRSVSVANRLKHHAANGLTISAITFAELSVGARSSREPEADRRRLEALSRLLEVRPFNAAAAEAYGALVRAVGVQRNSFDRLIAAHALALGATLVTNNEGDFADVPGLVVENWTLPL